MAVVKVTFGANRIRLTSLSFKPLSSCLLLQIGALVVLCIAFCVDPVLAHWSQSAPKSSTTNNYRRMVVGPLSSENTFGLPVGVFHFLRLFCFIGQRLRTPMLRNLQNRHQSAGCYH